MTQRTGGHFYGSSLGNLSRARRRTPPGGQPPPPPRRRVAPAPTARHAGWFASLLPKTIDRYVLGSFLKNYLLSLVVLVGIYCVLDMVFNFDEFVEVTGHEGVGDVQSAFQVMYAVADYYFYQSFRVFSYLAGVVAVVAAAFTLMRMSRQNELAALLAAGVPL